MGNNWRDQATVNQRCRHGDGGVNVYNRIGDCVRGSQINKRAGVKIPHFSFHRQFVVSTSGPGVAPAWEAPDDPGGSIIGMEGLDLGGGDCVVRGTCDEQSSVPDPELLSTNGSPDNEL